MEDFKARLGADAALMEKKLEEYLSSEEADLKKLYDAMRYSVLDGGKRIRPFLAIEFCRMNGGDDRTVLPFAAALEMIHCYSLVHDDLPCMDNDDYRRGKYSTHRAFGEAEAVLAGDALLTYAFEVASSNAYASDLQVREAVGELAFCAGGRGMVGGQILDLEGERVRPDYGSFIRMNELKTGRLIRCGAVLGCIASGGDRKAAEKFAYNVGLAFQITDDILDEGTDENKTTFLSFMTVGEAREKAALLLDEAKETVDSVYLKKLCDYLLVRNN